MRVDCENGIVELFIFEMGTDVGGSLQMLCSTAAMGSAFAARRIYMQYKLKEAEAEASTLSRRKRASLKAKRDGDVKLVDSL